MSKNIVCPISWKSWHLALLSMLARLRADRKGNVLMIMGFALIPLVFATGMVIDYSQAARLQTKLNAAADAASLSAVTQPVLQQPLLAGCNAARNTFLNALQQYNKGLVLDSTSTPTISIKETYSTGTPVTQTCPMTIVSNTNGTITNYCNSNPTDYFCITQGPMYCPFGSGNCSTTSTAVLPATRTVTVTYSANSTNTFGGILGSGAINIGGTATSSGNPVTYVDYYILLDISQSMGIGATQTDMTNLFARTTSAGNGGCVFGCHVTTAGQGQTNEYLAHNVSPRITLRIDSAVTAIQNIIADAQAAAGTANNIRIGLYTMSQDPVSGKQLNVVTSPSYNYSNVSTLAGTIDLGGNNSGGVGDTNYSSQMAQFNALVPTNGTGTSAASPLNYVFVISDGAADTPGSGCTSGHCTSAFDPTLCATLKTKSTVGTIYTTYLPIYNNNDSTQGYNINYQQLVLPFIAQIAPNMLSCATNSGYYYQASDATSLNTAMKALFASTLKTARLTQ